MNNIQDWLPFCTTPIVLLIALLTAIVQLVKIIKELWSELKPAIQYLLLFTTQLIPIGIMMWYYMYWAVQYHDRFTDRVVFMWLIAQPTIFIIIYEMFWGMWFYPKLLSFIKREVDEQPQTHIRQNKNDKRKSDIKPSSNKKHQ